MQEQSQKKPDDLVPDGWKNPPSLTDLKKDLEGAQSAHTAQSIKIRRWTDHLHGTGEAKLNLPKGRSKIQPKLIRKQAEWRYPSLSEPFLSTEDMFSVNPVTFEDVESAKQNELVLNHQFNTKINKVSFIDKYVRAAVDKGTAIVRVGWEFREEEVDEHTPNVEFRPNPELAPMYAELQAMEIDNPTGFQHEVPDELKQGLRMSLQAGQPMEAIVTGYTTNKVMKTVWNAPTMEVVPYQNVTLDPSCGGDADKAGFVIFSFETSQSELRKEGTRYKNLDDINSAEANPLADPDHATEDGSGFEFSDNSRKKFVAHEYWGFWDIDGSGVTKPFVCTWVGDTMIRMEENPFPDKKLPFVFVPFRPLEDSAYGEPDGELLIDNQKVIGAVTRGMIDIMARSANGQTGTRKGALDATNLRKFQTGRDYQYNGQVDPRQLIHMHTYPEIPASAQFMIQHESLEAESMSGVKAFSNGINGDSLGESVGNGRSVLDAASKRETAILRRLAQGIVEVGRKMISMNAEFLDEEEVVRITNKEFVVVRRDDLAGNFDLKLSISSAEEDAAKVEKLSFMFQTMGNTADPAITKIILTNITRLQKMPELTKALEEYEPQPDPMQQKLAELEIELKLAEIEKVKSETIENYANAALDETKAGTETSKARQLNSQADKQDLDFVEQEGGTKQERDKELAGVQAEGNIALEREKQMGHRAKELDSYLKNSS